MIKAFKFRAQAIFSLLEKTHPLVHKSVQGSYIHKKLDTNSCFAKLRANSYQFSFFIHPFYVLHFGNSTALTEFPKKQDLDIVFQEYFEVDCVVSS